jgi:hypothetical protein
MKKLATVIIYTFLLLVLYNAWLFIFPLKKQVFYTNEERIQEYLYDGVDYNTVLLGSSLSGIFERNEIFNDKNFMLYLPFSGSATGLEIVYKTDKVPKRIFIEINHVNRGVDSTIMHSIFDQPLYSMRYYLPFLQTKNKILPNVIDRVKSPANNKVNDNRPADELFNTLRDKEFKEWSEIKNIRLLDANLNHVENLISEFAARGCQIIFYEMPMDSSLTNQPVISHQRDFFSLMATKNKYSFIHVDTSRAYQTGDGVHLLRKDADIYLEYFRKELAKIEEGDISK